MDETVLALAKAEGFAAAILPVQDVPVDPKYRAFCEENLCGQYGANYSCPPDCGEVETLHRTILAQEKALVISTVWDGVRFDDQCAVAHAKKTHNDAVLRLMGRLNAAGCVGFCTGYNGCPLCEPCMRTEGKPCLHPEKRISCMSAYCIDVAELARRCDLPFGWIPGKLFLFGMIAYHEEGSRAETRSGIC